MRVWFAGGGTGGHLYPALGIARALVRQRPEIRPLFIGAQRGIERIVLPRAEFDHVLLNLHPLYRGRVWQNWRTIAGAFGAWRALAALAYQEKPAAIVGTGGYAAAMALLYASTRRIPIVLQEQNSFAGLTTRLFSRVARQIHLGFPEAASGLAPRAGALVRHSGNPIDPPQFASRGEIRARARAQWRFNTDAPLLLAFGGSQGARPINAAVGEWVRAGLPAGVQLLWVTGPTHHATYASQETERVRVVPFISPMFDAYAAADVALARSGAMSTAELCAWGVPMVLVPLPTAAADHQTANAQALAEAGAAIVIQQARLDAARLASVLGDLIADERSLERMSQAALARARPDAAREIARDLVELLTNAG